MKSEQFNFYVNPETEKELYDYLKSFPRSIRSHHIKQVLLEDKRRREQGAPAFGLPSAPAEPSAQVFTLGGTPTSIELSDDDLGI